MQIIVADNYKEMNRKAANIILNELHIKNDLVLGLATGSTPLDLYKELISSYQENRADFSKITTFNLDEYYPIKKDHPNSYRTFMHDNLFDKINIQKKNINLLNGEVKNHKKHCKAYEKKLQKNPIDIQILGIGANCHIGFNEPGSAFSSRTRKVNLTEKTIKDNSRFFDTINNVPKQALTMGLSNIMDAKTIILLANGQNKAQAIKDMLEAEITPKYPASILRHHRNCIIILDKSAAAKLSSEGLPTTINGFKILGFNGLPRGENIVVISPHPDDSCINIGGLIYKLSLNNQVHIFVMTTGANAQIPNTTREQKIKIREEETINECKILRSKEHFLRLKFYDHEHNISADISQVSDLLKKTKPKIIILPHKKDGHTTHLTARNIVLKAIEKNKMKCQLWNYETSWSLFHNSEFNALVPLTTAEMKKKIEAIRCHKSQIKRTKYDLAAKALAEFRGSLIPEQALSGFGENSIKMAKLLEMIYIE